MLHHALEKTFKIEQDIDLKCLFLDALEKSRVEGKVSTLEIPQIYAFTIFNMLVIFEEIYKEDYRINVMNDILFSNFAMWIMSTVPSTKLKKVYRCSKFTPDKGVDVPTLVLF